MLRLGAVRGSPCEEGPGARAEAQDGGGRGDGGGAGRRRLRVPRAPRAEGGPLRGQGPQQGAARLLLQLTHHYITSYLDRSSHACIDEMYNGRPR